MSRLPSVRVPGFAVAAFLVAVLPAQATPAPLASATSASLEAAWRSHSAPSNSQVVSASHTRQVPPTAARRSPASAPEGPVGAANRAARIEPEEAGFDNAIQRYAYREGALYQVYASPGQVTDIALQQGEKLVGPGPVVSGDTVRWMIGDTISGAGEAARVHILVKPTRPDIATNLVINTDRRTYHIELRARPRVYMASVSWTYPADELIALRKSEQAAELAAPVTDGMAIERLNFDYRLSGDKPAWRPVRVFDDGRQTLVEFPADIAQGEMPPFFVIGEGGVAELVNYRVAGRYLIVDRLFEKAELRLGAGRRQQRVTIANRARSGS